MYELQRNKRQSNAEFYITYVYMDNTANTERKIHFYIN